MNRETKRKFNIILLFTMIYSRFCFNTIGKAPKLLHSVLFGSSFEKVTDQAARKINQRIAKAYNVQSLLRVFEENKSSFKPFLIHASLKLNEFLEVGQDYNREMLFNFFRSLNDLKLAQLSKEEIITAMGLIRKFQAMGFRGFLQLKKDSLNYFTKMIQSKEYTEAKDIQELARFYELFSFFHEFDLQKAIYTKMYYLASQSINSNSAVDIPLTVINNFLKGIYYSVQPSIRQKRIRLYFLTHFQAKLPKVQLQEIMELCFNLLRMDLLDFSNAQLIVVKKVIEKVNKEIQNLSKAEMLRLLSIQDNIYNRNRLNYLYTQISNRIFDLISADGITEVPQLEILEFMIFICQKMRYSQLQESQHEKLFSLVNKLTLKAAVHPPSRSLLVRLLTKLLKNNFFNEKRRQSFKQTVKSISFKVQVQLIYQLALKNYDVRHLIKKLQIKQETKIFKLFMIGIALRRTPKINQDAQLSAIKAKLQTNLENSLIKQQNFIKAAVKINNFEDSEQLYHQIFKHFPELMKKMCNPYQKQSKNYEYTIIFTQFVLKIAAFQYSNVSKTFPMPENQISDVLLKDLIMREMRKDKYKIRPNKHLFYLIRIKMQRILANKNVILIKAIIQIMVRCNRFLVYKDLDIYLEDYMWKNLKVLTKNLPLLFTLRLNKQVNTLLTCYLSKTFKHYSHCRQFTDFVVQVLYHLPLLSNSLTTLSYLFPVALKLGVLQAKNCQDKTFLEKVGSQNTLRQMIKCLSDEKYEYKIQNSKDSQLDLQALVFNKNSLKFVEENIQKIEAKISTYSNHRLIQLLLYFNLPNQPATRRLVRKTLYILLSNIKSIEYLDMGRVFSKAVDSFYFMIKGYNQLFYRFVDQYSANKFKIKFLDTLTLIHLTKFVASQPQKKELSLFYKIVQDWFSMNIPKNQMLVLGFLIDTSYQFSNEELQLIPKIVQTYFRAGVKMFLYLQDRISPQKRKQIVKQIVFLLQSQSKEHKQTTIQDLYYRYIKQVYPEETKGLNLDNKRLVQFRFSSKPNLTIMNALNDVKSKLGLQIKLNQQFGNNQVFQLNETFIVFKSAIKTSSIYERKFIKKAVRAISKRSIPVFDFLNSVAKDQQIYLKLIKSKGLLLSGQQVEQLIRKSQQTTLTDNQVQVFQEQGPKQRKQFQF